MFIQSTPHSLSGDVFEDNEAAMTGGAVDTEGSTILNITNVSFTNNLAMLGGGFAIAASATLGAMTQITASKNRFIPEIGDGPFVFIERPVSRFACHNCTIEDLNTVIGSPPASAVVVQDSLYAQAGVSMAASRDGPVHIQFLNAFGSNIQGSYLGGGMACVLPPSVNVSSSRLPSIGDRVELSVRGQVRFNTYALLDVPMSPQVRANLSLSCYWRINYGVLDVVTKEEHSAVTVHFEKCLSGYRANITNHQSLQTLTGCVPCPDGTFSLGRGSDSCHSCPTGMTCSGGNQIEINKGFWEHPSDVALRVAFMKTVGEVELVRRSASSVALVSPVLHQCPLSGACPQQNGTQEFQCTQGYTGVVCALCADGYYISGSQCLRCGEIRPLTVVFFTLIGLAVVLYAVLYVKRKRLFEQIESLEQAPPDTDQSTITEADLEELNVVIPGCKEPPPIDHDIIVTVPVDCNPGDTMIVEAGQNRYRVQVPEKVHAGDKFYFSQSSISPSNTLSCGIPRDEDHSEEGDQDHGLVAGISALQTADINQDIVDNADDGRIDQQEQNDSESEEDSDEDDDSSDPESDWGVQSGAAAEGQAAEKKNSPIEDLKSMAKILIGHLQITGSLAISISVSWPSTMFHWATIADTLDLNFSSLLALDCYTNMTFYNTMVISMSLPVACFAGFAVASWIAFKCFSRSISDLLIPKAILLGFLIYPGLSQTMFQVYQCDQVDTIYYLSADYRLECYTSEWVAYALVAASGILVFTIGVPVWITVLLTRNRHKIFVCDQGHKFRKRFGFFYSRYEPEYYWYEELEMLRKILLSCVAIFVAPGEMGQVVFTMIIILVAITIQIKFQPYEEDVDDNLQLASLLSNGITVCYAALIVVGEDTELSGGLFLVLLNAAIFGLAMYTMVNDTIPSLFEQLNEQLEDLKSLLLIEEEDHEDSNDPPVHVLIEDGPTVVLTQKICVVCEMRDSWAGNHLSICKSCGKYSHVKCRDASQNPSIGCACKMKVVKRVHKVADEDTERKLVPELPDDHACGSSLMGAMASSQSIHEPVVVDLDPVQHDPENAKHRAQAALEALRRMRDIGTINELEYRVRKTGLREDLYKALKEGTLIIEGTIDGPEVTHAAHDKESDEKTAMPVCDASQRSDSADIEAVSQDEEIVESDTEGLVLEADAQPVQLEDQTKLGSKHEAQAALDALRRMRDVGTINELEYRARKTSLREDLYKALKEKALVHAEGPNPDEIVVDDATLQSPNDVENLRHTSQAGLTEARAAEQPVPDAAAPEQLYTSNPLLREDFTLNSHQEAQIQLDELRRLRDCGSITVDEYKDLKAKLKAQLREMIIQV